MGTTLVEGTNATWGTEYSLPNESTTLTAQTDKVQLTIRLDLGALVAGDVYTLKAYDKVNGGASTLIESWRIEGVHSEMYQVGPLFVGGGWDVTLTRSSGSDRSIGWTLAKETTGLETSDAAASIGTTEYSIVNRSTTLTAQTTDMILQPVISFANMATGDRYRIRVYEQADGGTSRPVYDRCVDHGQSRLWTCPPMHVGGGWNVTVTKVQGTDRVISWSVRTVNVATGPTLSSATTVEAIRDRIIAVIKALTPNVLSKDRFRESTNQGEADFIVECGANPAGVFRKFQVRSTGDDEPPRVSNVTNTMQLVTFRVVVAYPHTARYGADQALDRDDVMRKDQIQIEDAIGLHGQGNFVNPNPDAGFRDSSVTRLTEGACDFLVITQTMEYTEART